MARKLESLNLKIGNDRNRDLYILDEGGDVSVLFEVKTDVTTGSLYSGVGQLLLNSFFLSKMPKLILVIPKQLDAKVKKGLKDVGIECLIYKLSEGKATFQKLEEALPGSG